MDFDKDLQKTPKTFDFEHMRIYDFRLHLMMKIALLEVIPGILISNLLLRHYYGTKRERNSREMNNKYSII